MAGAENLTKYDSVDADVIQSYTEYSLASLLYYAMKVIDNYIPGTLFLLVIDGLQKRTNGGYRNFFFFCLPVLVSFRLYLAVVGI